MHHAQTISEKIINNIINNIFISDVFKQICIQTLLGNEWKVYQKSYCSIHAKNMVPFHDPLSCPSDQFCKVLSNKSNKWQS